MFLHLGNDTLVRIRDVVAIINYDGASATVMPRICEADKGSMADGASPKSVVVTASRIYLSPISPTTLARRV